MKKWAFLLATLFCLMGNAALAAKARNIVSDTDSQYHAMHLENHLDTTDVRCVVNNLRIRDQIDGQKVLGHLEQADVFKITEVVNGWAKIEVEKSARTSPDSWAGLSGWISTDYVDCYCSAWQYSSNTISTPSKSDTDIECKNYDEIIELYVRVIKENWDSDGIIGLGFDPCCFISSLEKDGYILKDLNRDGNDELIILSRDSLKSDGYKNFDDMIYAVYTVRNGKPIRVLESWTRSRKYLCADGGIYCEGSDGAAYTTYCIYDIKDGQKVLREGIQTSIKEIGNEKYKDIYLRMTEEHVYYDGEEISEEQAEKDLERYQNMLLHDDSDFVSFAEYQNRQ